MSEILRFRTADYTSDKVLFGKNFKISSERESGEMYRRTKIEGEVIFLDQDYDKLRKMDFNEQAHIDLIVDGSVEASADFYPPDCEFDTDNKICKLSPDFIDRYENILSHLEDEVNIVRLKPEQASIDMRKRAILQLYAQGDSKITNLVGNMSYEIDGEAERPQDYHFSALGYFGSSTNITATDSRIPESARRDLSGEFSASPGGIGPDNNPQVKFVNTYGTYFYVPVQHIENPPILTAYTIYWGDGTVSSYCVIFTARFGGSFAFAGSSSSDRYLEGTLFTLQNMRIIYARVLADQDFSGLFVRRGQDMTAENLNYRYVAPLSSLSDLYSRLASLFLVSEETQTDPTEWGQSSSGEYFVKPSGDSSTQRLVPIARSSWSPYTYWFIEKLENASYIEEFDTGFTLKDAYHLTSVIKKLLDTAETGIFGVRSQFLESATHPMISQYQLITRWFLTPITNIKKTYYDQAAQKGNISLKKVLDLLRTMNLYWILETENGETYLRIEHYKYFYNGLSYVDGSGTVWKDLTLLVEPRNSIPWSKDQNKITWDLSGANRLEFSWGTDVTEQFNGYPLTIKDSYMRKGSTEQVQASGFVTDVDLIIAQPDALDDDAFAFIQAGTPTPRGVYKTTLIQMGLGGNNTEVVMQNGFLSYLFIERYLRNYGLTGPNFEIEGVRSVCSYPARLRKQEVSFPSNMPLPPEVSLIKTDQGLGEVVSIDYNVESRLIKATLAFDTVPGRINLDPSSLQVPTSGGSYIIKIDSSKDWSWDPPAAWVYGIKIGSRLNLAVRSNSGPARSMMIPFTCGEASTMLQIYQSGS